MDYYLHWKQDGKWAEQSPNVVVLPGEPFLKTYPGGYKHWVPRPLSDAPDWVLKLMKQQTVKES